MNTFHQTDTFALWLRRLKDAKTRARILIRIRSAELGNFGDCAPVGEGVFEMRMHMGPGYRVYFWREGAQVYWLLAGGDKGTQQRDIEKAKALRQAVEEALNDNAQ